MGRVLSLFRGRRGALAALAVLLGAAVLAPFIGALAAYAPGSVCAAHQWVAGITMGSGAASAISCAQPGAGDVSGLAASATTDTTNASNISSGTLASARMGPVNAIRFSATYNLATASGMQVISGLAFTPSSCEGFGTVVGSSGVYTTLNAHSDSGANQGALYYISSNTLNVNNSLFFAAVDATTSNYQLGVISYGTNSITITWTKTGSPTGTFAESFRCFK